MPGRRARPGAPRARLSCRRSRHNAAPGNSPEPLPLVPCLQERQLDLVHVVGAEPGTRHPLIAGRQETDKRQVEQAHVEFGGTVGADEVPAVRMDGSPADLVVHRAPERPPGRARLVTSLTLPVSPPSPPALAPPGPYPT